MRSRHTWLLALAASLAACSRLPRATPSADSMATVVAGTLTAMTPAALAHAELPPTSTAPEATTPEPTPAEPTPTAQASPPVVRVAYTNGGNVWLAEGDAPPIQLTSSGSAENIWISGDGEKIVFTRRPSADGPVEVRVVNQDGTGESVIAPADTWNSLYPHGSLLFLDLNMMAFIPGTHRLLLNTRGIPEGPGTAKHDNLLMLDADSASLTTLLPPHSGGDFLISPDGQKAALTGPDSISMITTSGAVLRADAITFTPVTTYSEYQYYPMGQWLPDSSAIGFAIPSSDPLAPDASGTLWRLPADGGPAVNLATIAGEFFFTQRSLPALAPDLNWVAFLRETGTPNVRHLLLAHPDGSAETVYATGHVFWNGWSPDSAWFVFGLDAPLNLQIGALGSLPTPLGTGTKVRWASADTCMYLSGSAGAWMLMRRSIGAPAVALASPAGEFVAYDLIYR